VDVIYPSSRQLFSILADVLSLQNLSLEPPRTSNLGAVTTVPNCRSQLLTTWNRAQYQVHPVMDPVHAGFCLELPKLSPLTEPFSWTLPRGPALNPRQVPLSHYSYSSAITNLRPQPRFAALFPALQILRDVFHRKNLVPIQKLLQLRPPFKVSAMNISDISRKFISLPSQDPFSLARLPYLDCARTPKPKISTMQYARDWEPLFLERYFLLHRV
jgi:hypothetical protein